MAKVLFLPFAVNVMLNISNELIFSNTEIFFPYLKKNQRPQEYDRSPL